MSRSAPPFQAFVGWLKQIDVASLSDTGRLAVALIFPNLAPPSRESVQRRVKQLNDARVADHVLPVYSNRRRFAGDHTLGPRRYSTVADGANGNDGGTLQAELSAYASFMHARCEIYDGINPAWASEHILVYQPSSLLLRLSGTPGSNALIARLGTSIVWLPYTVTETEVPDGLDLRQPASQEWFCQEFADIHRHVALKMGVRLPPQITAVTPPANFFAMLPTLLDPQLGATS